MSTDFAGWCREDSKVLKLTATCRQTDLQSGS